MKHRHHRSRSPQDSESDDQHKRRQNSKRGEFDHADSSDESNKHSRSRQKQHHKREKNPGSRHNKHSRRDRSDSSQSDEFDSRHRKKEQQRQISDDGDNVPSEQRRNKHHKKHRHRVKQEHVEYDPNIRIKQERDNFERQERERSFHDQRRRDKRRERERGGGDFGMNRDVPIKQENREHPDGINNGGEAPKEEPNLGLSGKLTEDTNTFRGVVIKYNEPQEAMVPKRKWRLYPFKGEQSLGVLHIHRQSAYLMGRDRKICEIALDHPSSSKQHAVLQYRAVPYTRADGSEGRRVRPYIIDLESANGTYVNGDKIEAKRYVELREKDVMKFGYSTREYVLLHDKVDTSELGGDDMEET